MAFKVLRKRAKCAYSHLRDRSGKFAFNGGTKKRSKRSGLARNNQDLRDTGNRKVRRRERLAGAAKYALKNPLKVAKFGAAVIGKSRYGMGIKNSIRNAASTVVLNTTSKGFRSATRQKVANVVQKTRAYAAKHNLSERARQAWTGVTPGRTTGEYIPGLGDFRQTSPATYNALNLRNGAIFGGSYLAGRLALSTIQNSSRYQSRKTQPNS